MALVDPNDPYAQLNPLAGYTLPDAHEDLFRQWADQVPQDQSIILPGELSKHAVDVGSPLPPPPPPQHLDQLLPSYAEVANGNAQASPTTEAAPAPSLAPSSADAPMPLEEQAPPIPAPGTVGTTAPAAPSLSTFVPSIVRPGEPYAYGTPLDVNQLPDDQLSERQLTDREINESPEAFARRQQAEADRQQALFAPNKAKAEKQFAEDSENDLHDYLKSRDESRAEADRIRAEGRALAEAKIDPERLWKSKNAIQKVGGWVAAIVGGLVQGASGANENQGLKMIQSDIAQDIDAQKETLMNRRQAMGESRIVLNERIQRDQEQRSTLEKIRYAKYEQVINQFAQEAQNSDPRGQRAMRAATAIRYLRAQQAGAIRDAQIAKQKADLEIAKNNRDAAKLEIDAKNTASEIAARKATTQQGWARITNEKDQNKISNRRLDAEATKAEIAGNKAEAKEIRELGVPAPMKITWDEKGNAVIDPNASGVMRNPDGSVWKLPTVESAEKFRSQKESADMLISMIDEVRDIYEKSSRFTTASEWNNSKEHQRLVVIGKEIAKTAKKGTEGMSSDSDMNNLRGAAGADNLTSFRDQAGKLGEARDLVQRNLYAAAHNRGYQGDASAFTYIDPIANRAPPTPEEQQVTALLKYDPKRETLGIDAFKDLGIDVSNPIYAGSSGVQEMNARLDKEGGVLPSVKTMVLSLRDKLNDPTATPEQIKFAADALEKIATKAEDTNLRAFVLANAQSTPAQNATVKSSSGGTRPLYEPEAPQ